MNAKSAEDNFRQYHIRLQPDDHRYRLKLDEVWQYRDLVVLMTKKTFTMTYRQTVLGPLWIILNPVLSSLIYMFIFGHIAAIGTDGVPKILFYFVSSSVWALLSFSLTVNASTFISNASLFKKVYFPRLVVPISEMFVSILKFMVQLMIILLLMIYYVLRGSITPRWELFPLLPLLFVQMSFLGMSTGILISSFTTRYRDLMHLVSLAANIWMYASPVVYPLSTLGEGVLKTVIRINPVTEQMELIRLIMLGKGEFDIRYYLLGLAVTIILFICGTLIFNRVERTFADTV